MSRTSIDTIYEEYQDIIAFLKKKDISMSSTINNDLKKTLTIYIASYFEDQVKSILTEYCRRQTNYDPIITSFLKKKAIDRQYHSFFRWDERKANSFLHCLEMNLKKVV